MEVNLKCLQNFDINEFLIEVNEYSINKNILKIYGISQNPETKNYFMVLQDGFCEKCGEGGFATVYSAIWKDGPLKYNMYKKKYERVHLEMKKFALKALNGSHNITDSFLNEVKAYSISTNMFDSNILKIYGISQNPVTKDYIIILDHAEGGSFNDWIKVKYNNYINWKNKLHILHNIISGLKEIHENKLIHRDFHTGNILFDYPKYKKDIRVCISDMGLCGERKTLYSNELEAPDYFVDLMKRCWDANPDNRPNAIEIHKLFSSFKNNDQFKEPENYNLTAHPQNHPQAVYTSRLLNSYTDNLSENYNSDRLDCTIID
ncbi:kinase-like domain-containing protein [Rhizophagus clarus]|uniref:Kinase-like domain-containing protein n=1 Tax=Rhizophagus clarus TaxID=94130 RepID=A0A8H3M3I3_9GLOM|nr:kinase-like domain-containing protein [Rhizophagus clarus]